ncbi:MAG: 3-beta hydroxysteroid dehydrogenase/isomerase family protein [Firmicutes bacterium]|nr:3-beta hydroxysteroid dehydrogenase/isomerase family protein [Bacillota bacterium]
MLLVTGITGHSGKYFLQELVDNKYGGSIRCILRKSSDTLLLDSSGLNIEKIVGDLNEQAIINQAMMGIDTVVHIYNIEHSPEIVEAAIKNNVKRVILVHTTGIYSQFKYASEKYKNIEKTVIEQIKDASCPTKVTILRPTMIYGDLCDRNISKFIYMVDKCPFIPLINGGKSLIQPVNARDIGKALFAVLMKPDKLSKIAYDLSGDKPITMIDTFKLISDELDKKRIFISVPLGLGVLLAKALKVLTLGKIDYVEKVQRMGEDRSYPHDDATKEFGYSPMNFEEGIKIEVTESIRK